jgi:hypothetical protein
MVTIFPSILPDGSDFVDDAYTQAELARMDGRELQSLAAEHPTDECDGRDSADTIRAMLQGKQRV